MVNFPAAILSALIAATAFGTSSLSAQDAAILRPAPEGSSESDPNWPAGLENWDSTTRNPEGNPNEAEERGLTSDAVEDSNQESESDQGTRDTENVGEDEDHDLYELLARVRTAPPSLEGEPIRRPNPLASEPLAERQPEDFVLFPDNYVE